MATYVIAVVNSTKLYPNIDPFIPQPAMGNMLPTTKGYDEKFQEKLFKIQSEIVADPLFAYPTDLSLAYYTPAKVGQLPEKLKVQRFVGDEIRIKQLGLPVDVDRNDFVVTGVNPFVDRALLTGFLARTNASLPCWCKPDTEVLDIWKFLSSSNDWRTVATLWDLSKDPMEATREMIDRLLATRMWMAEAK